VATTVSIVGSTGSIGTQTLDVVAREGDRYEVVALGAGSSVEQLAEQAQAVRPKVVAIADASRAAEL
jgi:1-deoxy-D-xylulose-5-phosphate reductoisomerase